MVRQHVRKTWDSIQQMCFCDTLCFPTSCPHISSFVSSAFWGLPLIISSTKINQVSKDKEVASVWKSEFQKQSRKQSSHLNLRNKTNKGKMTILLYVNLNVENTFISISFWKHGGVSSLPLKCRRHTGTYPSASCHTHVLQYLQQSHLVRTRTLSFFRLPRWGANLSVNKMHY